MSTKSDHQSQLKRRMRSASAAEIASVHDLRSEHVRRLVIETVPHGMSPPSISPVIPPVIVQYWHDKNSIPSDVQQCIDTWDAAICLGFDRVMYDDVSAVRFISDNFDRHHVEAYKKCNHPAMRCDYFRLCYLVSDGGLYIDADDKYSGGDLRSLLLNNNLKLQALCFDLNTGQMLDPFLSAEELRSSKNRIFYVNNNPIAAPSDHPLLYSALKRSTEALLGASVSRDIQDLTGPGNLTTCLVKRSIELSDQGLDLDFELVRDIERLTSTVWELEYRQDERNWRIWSGLDA